MFLSVDTSSWGCELKPYIGRGAYLEKKRRKNVAFGLIQYGYREPRGTEQHATHGR